MVRPGFHDDNVRMLRAQLDDAEKAKRDAVRNRANSSTLTALDDTIRKTSASLASAERARNQAKR